ncbi:MAG TPA: hypothetical protein VJ302_32195 [Blastocatellia bacterium]|nr:hypothetical protein [Blastocatellia bacterium]
MKSFLVGIKNVLLWSYERGSWQYDLLCLSIIATIFLVPSHYFGDRDRLPTAQANLTREIASKTGEPIFRSVLFTSFREVEATELQAVLAAGNQSELMGSPREALVFYLRNQLKREIGDLYYTTSTNSHGQTVYRVWFK